MVGDPMRPLLRCEGCETITEWCGWNRVVRLVGDDDERRDQESTLIEFRPLIRPLILTLAANP